jgi:hypothetical protein
MDGKMYRLRRLKPVWSGMRGEMVEFLYCSSYGEALHLDDSLPDVATGPIEVRCNIHGWTTCGAGDVCGKCAEWATDRDYESAVDFCKGQYTIKCWGDEEHPVQFKLLVNLRKDDIPLIEHLGYAPREEHGNSILELPLPKRNRIVWKEMSDG